MYNYVLGSICMIDLPIAAHAQYYSGGMPAKVTQPRQSALGIGDRMVTYVVKPRKLTRGFNRHFPPPWCHLGAKPVLQTKWLLERVSVFGRFLGYQIVPNFTIFYQKRAAKGVRTGSKRQLTGGFFAGDLLKRVKPGGQCQAVIGEAPRFRKMVEEIIGRFVSHVGQA